MTDTDPFLGPAFPGHGWIPAPRYLMRRARILELSRHLPPGRMLEVGPGAAMLLSEFSSRGFRCEGLESSAEARALADTLVAARGDDIPLHAIPQPGWDGAFDALCAFEVLEHIEDDVAALRAWHAWLRPGGTLLLSVPARMSLWNAGDEWAGHFRRYERDALRSLLRECGFEIEAFECYGFPLANISERISAGAYRRTLRTAGSGASDRQANNDRSGVDRRAAMRVYPLIRSLPGRLALRAAMGMQALCLRRDWGNGYVLRAIRR